MLQPNVFRYLATCGGPLLRSAAVFVAVAVLLVSSCTVTREIDDLAAGCPEGTKQCGQECVPIDDPNFGCLPDSCEPCQADNVTEMSCTAGECVATRCDASRSKLCDAECVPLDVPELGCARPGCDPCNFYKTAEYACSNLGSCEVLTCEPGWDDCDVLSVNGCEVNTREDIKHCGNCDIECDATLPHGQGTCGAGACVIRACDRPEDTPGSEFEDCDKIPSNGCEADLMTSDLHCGECGARCDADQVCTEGVCTTP